MDMVLLHLLKLVDFQNRLTVTVQWGWNFITRNQSAHLTTGPFRSSVERATENMDSEGELTAMLRE